MYMKYKKNFKFVFNCIFYLFVFSSFGLGQTNPQTKIHEVTSWKKGDNKINLISIDVDFRSEEFDYNVLTADGKRKFRLNIRKQYIRTIEKKSYQCAVITLKEVLPSNVVEGNDLGMDMLNDGDPLNTPRNIICPVKSPSIFERNISPFNSIRIFNVENFSVKTTPIDFKYNNDSNLLSNLRLIVEFYNNSKETKSDSNRS